MTTSENEQYPIRDIHFLPATENSNTAAPNAKGYTFKLFLTSLLLIFLSTTVDLQAQQLKIDFSSQGKDIKNDVTSFHRYGKYIYSNKTIWGKMQFAFSANLKKVKNGVEISKYDENLKVIKALSLDNNERDFGPFIPLVHYGENAIYVLYWKYTDDNKITLYATKINPEDLSITTTKELMHYDQKNQGLFAGLTTIEETKTFYTVSKDGKNVWVVHASPKLILSCVIDGDLNIVRKPESTLVKLEKLLVTGAHIGNDGNKVLVYRYDNPTNPEYFIRGLYFEPADKKGTFKTITFPSGYSPGNLVVQSSKNDMKLYLAGEYFGKDFFYGGQGVMLGEIDMATQSISTPKFFPYTDQIKQRVLDLDFASKKKGEIVFTDHNLNYRINEMDNGTIVLSSDHKSGTFVGASNTEFYYNGPIIHAFIKPDGNAVMNLIPKKQVAGSATEFFNYKYQDKLICIYGDHLKFLEKELPDQKIGLVRMPGGIIPVAVIYDSDGKLISKKILINDTKAIQGNVMIGDWSEIENNRFLMPIGRTKVNMIKYYTSISQMCYVEVL